MISPATKSILIKAAETYNCMEFISTDPIQIPHRYNNPRDIEISAFLTATIAWGQRKTIISNALGWMKLMDEAPHQFIVEASESDMERTANRMTHRTFQPTDAAYFLKRLKELYSTGNTLESLFTDAFKRWGTAAAAISAVRPVFIGPEAPKRTHKHFSDPARGSSAKRLNMFLRWMVRRDDAGVDFGLWEGISPAQLDIPLDVHSGNMARELGLLQRKLNDQRAVQELMAALRSIDPLDPVRFDYALFGLGAFKNHVHF